MVADSFKDTGLATSQTIKKFLVRNIKKQEPKIKKSGLRA